MELRPGLVLTEALARVWDAIQAHHPAVPSVVLLPVPNPHQHRNVLGHFAAMRWQGRTVAGGKRLHEVVVVAEHLDRQAADIVGTLLHEAAHALNFERGTRDCSASQYHNRVFLRAAEELGLQVEQVPHYGFAVTRLLPETAARYAAEIAALETVLLHRKGLRAPVRPPNGTATPPTGTDSEGEGEDPSPKGRYLKASCTCPLNIRVARATLAATTIRCETCDQPFRIPG